MDDLGRQKGYSCDGDGREGIQRRSNFRMRIVGEISRWCTRYSRTSCSEKGSRAYMITHLQPPECLSSASVFPGAALVDLIPSFSAFEEPSGPAEYETEVDAV